MVITILFYVNLLFLDNSYTYACNWSCQDVLKLISIHYLQQEEYFLQTQLLSPLTATGLRTYCHNSTWIGNIAFTNAFPSLDIISSVRDQYVVSLYWATATLVSVGYGDIHAYSPIEMFIATFVMIGGTVFYSFILGGMSASVQTDDIRRGNYKEKIKDIKKFFKVYDVSQLTEDQVSQYFPTFSS